MGEEFIGEVVRHKIAQATARSIDHIVTIEMLIMEKIIGKVMLMLDDADFMKAVKQDIRNLRKSIGYKNQIYFPKKPGRNL